MSGESFDQNQEETHLVEEHGLKKVIAYASGNDGKKRSSGAEWVFRTNVTSQFGGT